PRPIHELVAQHEVARVDVALETACGARADHGPYAQRAERPDVGAVVDAVRRNRVASAVARHERHLAPGHLGQEDAVGRRPGWPTLRRASRRTATSSNWPTGGGR